MDRDQYPPSGFFDEATNVFTDGHGQRLSHIHDEKLCADRDYCVIHRQSVHHMSTWPLLWRADRRIFERTCPHGVGHPDPDDMAYHRSIGNDFEGVHGCDGCCRMTYGEINPRFEHDSPHETGREVLLEANLATMTALCRSLQDDIIDANDYIDTLEGNLEGLQMSYDTMKASRNFWRNLTNTMMEQAKGVGRSED